MAFGVNIKNVGICGFFRNDELILLECCLSDGKEDGKFQKLKCVLENVEKQDESNGKVKLGVRNIVSAAVSNCKKYVAACDSQNSLHLWEKTENSYELISARPVARKCQKVIFTNSGSNLIVSDRGGDVFMFSVDQCKKHGEFILGHISLIIDITISNNDEFLATCDRDGKIRISCFPNCYNIYSYCLGHEEFVSSLHFISSEVLLSSSGDGTLRLWKFKSGSELCRLNLFENEIFLEEVSDESATSKLDASENYRLPEKQIKCSVRSVIYNNKLNVCVVVFHLISGVALYRLSGKTEGFLFVQYIPLPSHALDLFFDADASLYIVLESKEKPVLLFKWDPDKLTYAKADDANNLILKGILKFPPELQNIELHKDYEILFKHCYDALPDKDVPGKLSKKHKIK